MEAISNILLSFFSWVPDLASLPSIFTLLISLNPKKPCLWSDLCSVLSLLPFCLLISFSFPDHHRTTQKCFCTFPSWYLLAMTVLSSFWTLFFVPHLQSKSRTCPHSSWKLEPDFYTLSFSKILINSWQTLYFFLPVPTSPRQPGFCVSGSVRRIHKTPPLPSPMLFTQQHIHSFQHYQVEHFLHPLLLLSGFAPHVRPWILEAP